MRQDPNAAHTLFNRLQTIQTGYRTQEQDSITGTTNTSVKGIVHFESNF